MGSFWKKIGSALAKVAVGVAKGALWASDHPAVIAQVVGIAASAGVPGGAIDKVNAGVAISNTIVGDVQAVKATIDATRAPAAPAAPGSVE